MSEFIRAGLSLWILASALAWGCTPQARLEDIRNLQEAGHFEATIEPLRERLEATPDDPELNHLYGVALLQTRQPELAIWPLRKAARDPDRAVEDGLLLAQALYQGGSAADAVEAANRVLELAPDRVEAIRVLIESKLASRRHEEVITDADRLLALQPDDVGAQMARALALLSLDRVDEAEQALTALREAAENAEGGSQWQPRMCGATATFLKEKGDPEAGEAMWGVCLERHPADEAVIFGAVEFFNESSRPARSLEILRRAHDADPTNLQFTQALSHGLAASGQAEEAEQLLLDATRDGVNDAQDWVALSSYYEQRGQLVEARNALAQGLRLFEETTPAQMAAYVDLLIRTGEYDQAEQIIPKLEGEPAMVSLLRGRLLLGRGKPAEALATLREGIRLWPDNSVARWLVGQAAEQLGDYDQALAAYQESLRNDPENWDAVASLLPVLEALGHYREGVAALVRYQGERPRDPLGLVQLIRFASRSGQLEIANRAIRELGEIPGQAGVLTAEIAAEQAARRGAAQGVAVIRNAGLDLEQPVNGPALDALVRHLIDDGRPGEALVEVDAALAAHPDEALFHELRGRALRAAGQSAQAQQAFERALELEAERASALAGLAALASQRGERDAAVALYDRAYRADPEEPAYAWRAIELLAASDDGEEVDRRLEALLARHGTHAAAANLLARRLLASDPERALALARRAVRFRGGADALETLGRIQLERASADRAVKTLNRSLELRPDSPSTRYWLGLALSETGDIEGARAALNAALEAQQFPEREDALARLAGLSAE